MAGSRTLKLSILADVDDLKKKLDTGSKEVEGFGGKLEKFSKVAAAAFAAAAAAAAAYAGKLAIEGVKAAIEDEAAQKRLALALQNVTKATDSQIAAVEEQILKTSLATGVADDKLRPALQRLAVATGSVEKSQELLTLALDVSAATGKDVESVSLALAKAYDGNLGSLTRLGIGISAAEAKTLGFEGVVSQLSNTFGGSAKTQAETFEGRIARINVAFDEAKETIGTALLPIVEKLLTFITEKVVPGFNNLKTTAIDPVIAAFDRNKESLTTLYNLIKDFIIPIILNNLGAALKFLGTLATGILDIIGAVVSGIKTAVSAAITAINTIIKAYNAIPLLPNIPTIPVPSSSGSTTKTTTVLTLPTAPKITTPPITSTPTTTSATGSTNTAVTATAPKVTIPSNVTLTSPFNAGSFREGEAASMAGMTTVVNVYAPSAIDKEGFSRAVVEALNESQNRGGGGGGGGLRATAAIL